MIKCSPKTVERLKFAGTLVGIVTILVIFVPILARDAEKKRHIDDTAALFHTSKGNQHIVGFQKPPGWYNVEHHQQVLHRRIREEVFKGVPIATITPTILKGKGVCAIVLMQNKKLAQVTY